MAVATHEEVDAIFSQEFLQQLERLSLLARQLVRGSQRAERRAEQRGVSPEFAEHRPYLPGDDTRFIDWNAYARWRHLVLKIFIEEHDLPIYLALDCSRSMDFGQPNKFTYARQVVAGFNYIGLANHDRVGVVPFGERADSPNPVFPANRGKSRFWSVLQLLAGYQVNPGAHQLEDEVRRWLLSQPRRGMVIWVSDLFGADSQDALRALDRLRYSRHEIGVIQLHDIAEANAGEVGEYQLESVESGSRQPVLVDQRVKREYSEKFEAYQNEIATYCKRHRIPLLQTDTGLPVPDLLMRVLRVRGFLQSH